MYTINAVCAISGFSRIRPPIGNASRELKIVSSSNNKPPIQATTTIAVVVVN
jgi:hypothetical protein